MKICLISTEYPPDTGWGGIGTHTYELAHGLVNAGNQVFVVSLSDDVERCYEDDGVNVYRVIKLPLLERRGFWRIQKIWNTHNLSVARTVANIAAKHGLDIVEAPESRAESLFIGYPIIRSLPVIVKLHTGTYWNWILNNRNFSLRDRLTVWMERLSIRRADLVVSPSQALIDLNRTEGGYLRADKPAVLLRNPISTARFATKESVSPIPGNYVLYVGRLEDRKGVPILFDAMRHVWQQSPHLSLVLVGKDTGIGKQLVKGLPHEHQQKVILEGFVQRERIPDYYRHAVATVLPSRWENFPYTCLEAMACASPLIVSKHGGMAEMLEHDLSGFTVDPADSSQIAHNILQLLRDPMKRISFGRNALETVKRRFDTAVVVEETMEVYRRAVLDKGGRNDYA